MTSSRYLKKKTDYSTCMNDSTDIVLSRLNWNDFKPHICRQKICKFTSTGSPYEGQLCFFLVIVYLKQKGELWIPVRNMKWLPIWHVHEVHNHKSAYKTTKSLWCGLLWTKIESTIAKIKKEKIWTIHWIDVCKTTSNRMKKSQTLELKETCWCL